MLSYELCKELKDAGFPQIRRDSISKEVNPFSLIYPKDQKWFEGWALRPAPEHTPNAIHIDDEELKCLVGAYHPTLSELIEACGERFSTLVKDEGHGDTRWFADTEDGLNQSIGPTPEEAVARLWLALNTKYK